MKLSSEKEMYSCEYCDSKISVLTKKLQSKPTASLTWWKHGVCSASCSSKIKINKSVLISNSGLPDSGSDYNNRIDPASDLTNTVEALSPEESDIIKTCRRRKTACHIVLITANFLQFAGLVGGILLFYSNKPINVLYGLGLFLVGLILIRMSKYFSIKLGKTMDALSPR